MGYDEDLVEGNEDAPSSQTVKSWLASQQIVPMSREEAYAPATSMVGDCRVTQVVDIRRKACARDSKAGVCRTAVIRVSVE